jgi:hypothetical protein
MVPCGRVVGCNSKMGSHSETGEKNPKEVVLGPTAPGHARPSALEALLPAHSPREDWAGWIFSVNTQLDFTSYLENNIPACTRGRDRGSREGGQEGDSSIRTAGRWTEAAKILLPEYSLREKAQRR